MKILILRHWVPQHDPYLSHTSLQHEGTNMIVDVYGNVIVVDSMSFEFSNRAAFFFWFFSRFFWFFSPFFGV